MRKLLGSIYEVRRDEWPKLAILFVNFFLIVSTYYVCKSIRGALVIQKLGADFLPYVWILGVGALVVFVGIYGKLVDRLPRQWVVFATGILFMLSLGAIKMMMNVESAWVTVSFYVWGDIFSVVMIEQFWSACNDIFKPGDAKRLYGIIGSGGILGGLFGGGIVGFTAPLIGTANMAYLCMGVIALVIASSFVLKNFIEEAQADNIELENPNVADLSQRLGTQKRDEPTVTDFFAGFRLVKRSRYLTFIALALVLTQVVSTVIDFQFNKAVESYFTGLDDKSAFFGKFYMVLNLVSFIVMAFIASPVYRYLGLLAGLLPPPVVNLIGAVSILVFPLPAIVFLVKLLDKSLMYSIGRGSREILYTHATREEKYKAKAVIDMFGYRASKILGAAVIIPFTAGFTLTQLNIVNIFIITSLIITLVLLFRENQRLVAQKQNVQSLSPEGFPMGSSETVVAPRA